MTFENIRKTQLGLVKERNPFYAECSFCGKGISDQTYDGVLELLVEREWKYNRKDDQIICDLCIKKVIL